MPTLEYDMMCIYIKRRVCMCMYVYIYNMYTHTYQKKGDATNINPLAIQRPGERTKGPSGEFVKSLEELLGPRKGWLCLDILSIWTCSQNNETLNPTTLNPKSWNLKSKSLCIASVFVHPLWQVYDIGVCYFDSESPSWGKHVFSFGIHCFLGDQPFWKNHMRCVITPHIILQLYNGPYNICGVMTHLD
jgi:hypothetical protein